MRPLADEATHRLGALVARRWQLLEMLLAERNRRQAAEPALHEWIDAHVRWLEEALARHGRPEILNTDQGSQFTGAAFTGVLIKNDIAVSMDGKGAWRDNVFVERLWRSVKYEEVYLRAYEGVSDARASIGRYLDFYNGRLPHSGLDGITPGHTYFTPLPLRLAA